MEYLSVKEVAELKGCSIQYINRIAKNGKLEAIQEINAGNNCMQYKIPLSALPEELKTKYYKQRKKELGILPELEKPSEKASDTVKRSLKRLDEFTETERQQIALWINILNEWQAARSKFKNKTDADPLFCGKVKLEHPDIDISVDILYRKYKAYTNNNLQGLTENRGGWNRGKCGIPETAWNIFTSYYLTTHRLTIENCYSKTLAVCKEYYPELVGNIPSSRTFRRQAEKIPDAIVEFGRFGNKAFADKYLEYAERDLEHVKCNDIWIADNHTLDFFSLSDDGEVHRASITTFQDAKSGVIVAAELCDHPNSDTTRLALRSACLQGFGLPISVYFDNGSEFLSGDIAGRGHRRKKDWQKTEVPVKILDLLGIRMINAIPRNAKAKPIERFFNTFKEHYSKSIESYCGGTPSERPEECKKLVKERKLITDEELREIIPVFIKGHNSELYGGKEKRFKKMRRIDVWNEAIRSGDVAFRTSDKANLNLLMRRTTKVQKIKRNGVFIEWAGKKIWYNNEDTVFHIDKDREVYVRFDPADLDEVQVYDKNTDKYLYTYQRATYLDLSFVDEKEENIQTYMRHQSSTRKTVKKVLDDHRKFDAVSLLKAELLRAEQNSKDYEIAKPESFEPVIASENEASRLNIKRVEFADIKRLNEINEKSKGA